MMQYQKEKEHLLFKNLPDAYAFSRVVFDNQGNPADCIFLDVNPAFEALTGLKREEIIDQKFTAFLSGSFLFNWIEIYERLSRAGEYLRFKQFCELLNCWFEVTTYSNGPGLFITILRDITEQVRMESELEKQRNLLLEAERLALLGAWEWDLETDNIEFSDGWLQIFGVEKENIYSQNISREKMLSLIHPEDIQAVVDALNAVSEGLKNEVEHRITRFDNGEERHVHARGEGVTDKEGQLSKVSGVTIDITERKRAEERLRDAHERLYVVMNSLDVAILVTDLKNHEVLFINEHAKKIWGDIKGSKCWQFFNPGYAGPCHTCNLGQLVDQSGQPTGARKWEYEHNGRWYHSSERAIRWVDGRMVRLAIKTDITERKEMEEVLRENEEHYRQIVELMPLAIFSHRQEEIVFANTAAADMLHVDTPQLLLGQSLENYLHVEYRELFKEQIKKVIEKRVRSKSLMVKVIPEEGKVADVVLNLVPFMCQGHPAAQVVAHDITRNKKMEEELYKADKLESISILAGGVAHDFNNYLATMLGNISLAMANKDNPDKVYEKLENMKRAVLRAKDLTQRLFVFSKGEIPNKKPLCLNSLINDCATFALSGSNVCGNFSIPQELSPVEADEGQISQVLYNIIINALQAMPEGGNIKIVAENVALQEAKDSFVPLPEGEYVKISIEDEGPGMPEKHLQKIFDPFYSTKVEGSGLGLATAYSIVQNHDGYIKAESEEGKGTTFSMYLPAYSDDHASSELDNEIIYDSGKILVMEDQEEVREVLGEMLFSLGYEVFFAEEGSEALHMYFDARHQARPFDLVIMDLTVAGGTGGKTIISELLEKDPSAKTIISSGYSNDPAIIQHREYGFKGAIKKPFTVKELSQVIYRVMREE